MFVLLKVVFLFDVVSSCVGAGAGGVFAVVGSGSVGGSIFVVLGSVFVVVESVVYGSIRVSVDVSIFVVDGGDGFGVGVGTFGSIVVFMLLLAA